MLTDAEARDLLHAAADTIDVGPAEPLPVTSRPHLWPMLVAAAAVIAIVATTLALADRGASPGPSNAPSPTPAVNRIPPVMGLDPGDAIERLEAVDLEVRTRTQPGCVSPTVAAGTTPPIGSRFSPGDVVQLTVLDDSMGFCLQTQDHAWELLRFAIGVTPLPRTTKELTLYPGGGAPVVLSAEEAADPANWEVCDGDGCGSALAILAEAASTSSSGSPVLTAWETNLDSCSGADFGSQGRLFLGIAIAPPTDGITVCPQVSAVYSAAGALEAVAIPLRPEADSDPAPTAAAEATAKAFVAWARGSGAPPAFTDEVRYLVNDSLIRTMSSEKAARPQSWRVCFSGVPLGCPSLVKTLERYAGTVVQTSTPAVSCVNRTGRLPDDVARLELVRLDAPEAKGCSTAFAVELFVDDAGRIAAINHLPGSAAPPAR